MEEHNEHPVRPGEQVGPYTILEEVGRGGMGVVYRAYDPRLDREVALKCPWPRLVEDPAVVERFRREARAAAGLTHPHIVPVHEVFDHEGLPWIAMGFVRGRSLRARLREGRPSVDEIVQWAQHLAGALDEAHGRGILHRDINPKNVMIGEDGRALLTDFGLARRIFDKLETRAFPAPTREPIGETDLTRTGTVMGTPAYMSPEQVLGVRLDERSDLFALGLVLYEMCTGRPLLSGDDLDEIYDALEALEPPAVREENPEVPPELERIIQRLLARDPEDRYADARSLMRDLRELQRRREYRRYLREHPWARYRVPALMAALAGVSLLAVLVGSLGRNRPPREIEPQVRALVTWASDESGSRFSPDGRWISFLSDRDGRVRIWVLVLADGTTRPVTPAGMLVHDHVWSPDGKEIACLTGDWNRLNLTYFSLLEGGTHRRYPLGEGTVGARLVRWVGPWIYVGRRTAGEPVLERMRARDGKIEPVVLPEELRREWFDVDVDDRGERFLFALREGNGAYLVLYDSTTGKWRRLTQGNAFDADPRWLGRTGALVYTTNRSGLVDLMRLHPAEGWSERLTLSVALQQIGDTSPDGRRLTVHPQGAAANLWQLDLETGRTKRLTADSRSDLWPRYAPRADWVVFRRSKPKRERGASLLEGELLLARVSPEGFLGEPRVAAEAAYYAWPSPDGTWLAYAAWSTEGYPELFVAPMSGGAGPRLLGAVRPSALSPFPADWYENNAAWTSEGTQLCFVGGSADAGWKILCWSPQEAGASPRALFEAPPGTALYDICASPTEDAVAWVASRGLEQSGEAVLYVAPLPQGPPRVVGRVPLNVQLLRVLGWWKESSLIALRSRPQPDWTERVDVLELRLSGAVRQLGSIRGTFTATATLDAAAGCIYLTCRTAQTGAHNVHRFRLADATLERVTDNAFPGITYSGLARVGKSWLFYAEQRRNNDLWLVELKE